jgi:hypothetical protein
MRKTETVKIKIDDSTEKSFEVRELTVEEIIKLTTGSEFFNPPKRNGSEEQDGLFDQFSGIGRDIQALMDLCCDFTVDDLRPLTPSAVNEIYEAFQRVNKSFFSSLKAMGVAQALIEVRDAALMNFSEQLAISLKADT